MMQNLHSCRSGKLPGRDPLVDSIQIELPPLSISGSGHNTVGREILISDHFNDPRRCTSKFICDVWCPNDIQRCRCEVVSQTLMTISEPLKGDCDPFERSKQVHLIE